MEVAEIRKSDMEEPDQTEINKTNPDPDSELVIRAQKGDRKAFDTLVKLHQENIYRLALKYLKNHENAMDAVQDTFLNAYRHIGKFEGNAQFSSWIHRIAINVCLMRLRKKYYEFVGETGDSLNDYTDEESGGTPYDNKPSELMLGLDGEPARELFRRELSEQIKKAIGNLRNEFQFVIIMRGTEEMPYAEIAGLIGSTETATKTRMFRAKNEFRALLAQYLGEEIE